MIYRFWDAVAHARALHAETKNALMICLNFVTLAILV